ncbi:type II toxin-antitoxin system death-on-curing family toxin [Paremcibacter congregatus]|uniref:type II toxin-antitoxin system death-on-curing family toxin n=1 Tax=Paremcibacter congregatus TaxID=2043170 RepID=UPI003A8ECDE9
MAEIIAIHDSVIEVHELQGMAPNKSIDAIIARIDTRLAYGMIRDVYDLAASYACYIAVGHAFNDANKRTAFAAMDICLTVNGIELSFDPVQTGQMIIKAAQGIVDENELANYLKSLE